MNAPPTEETHTPKHGVERYEHETELGLEDTTVELAHAPCGEVRKRTAEECGDEGEYEGGHWR